MLALYTDFGWQGPYVGQMKLALYEHGIAPAAVLDLMMTSRDVARSGQQRYAPESDQSRVEYVGGLMMFTTTYKGSIVHRQWMQPDAAVWGEGGSIDIAPPGLNQQQIDTGLPIQQLDHQRFPAPPPPSSPPPSSES